MQVVQPPSETDDIAPILTVHATNTNVPTTSQPGSTTAGAARYCRLPPLLHLGGSFRAAGPASHLVMPPCLLNGEEQPLKGPAGRQKRADGERKALQGRKIPLAMVYRTHSSSVAGKVRMKRTQISSSSSALGNCCGGMFPALLNLCKLIERRYKVSITANKDTIAAAASVQRAYRTATAPPGQLNADDDEVQHSQASVHYAMYMPCRDKATAVQSKPGH